MAGEKRAPLCRLTGTVVHGKGKGHTVGMPTANLQWDPAQTPPAEGVYATLAAVEGTVYRAVTNVGRRPTVDSDSRETVESLLLGYAGDLYGKEMELTLYRRLRGIRKFPSLQAVKDQVDADCASVNDFFDSWEDTP